MPLHEELEYDDLHYAHPRHTIEDDQNITIKHNVQYVVFTALDIGDDAGIILESGSDLIIV